MKTSTARQGSLGTPAQRSTEFQPAKDTQLAQIILFGRASNGLVSIRVAAQNGGSASAVCASLLEQTASAATWKSRISYLSPQGFQRSSQLGLRVTTGA